ncbi:MAG: thioredoxin domain-containing protein, partial [Henriciella sp.]|nr:thioredoxin domain-containing protein [Henriciella sp.]
MTRTFSMALAATAIALTPACAQEQIDTASREAIEKVVYDYIIENPEIIEEALIALTEKRQLEEDERTRTLISENLDALQNNAADYSIGPADAKVTVVEFFDYRCGFCKRSASWAIELPEKYDNQVRVVFKELPILS